MQLYLIRHAESENNAKPPALRVEDPQITPIGHSQARHLAAWLQTLTMDVLITSPVRRALQTTRYVRDATGQHVHVWANVFEEGGIYRGHGPEAVEGGPGLTRDQVLEHLVESASQCTLDEVISDTGWWGSKPRESAAAAASRAHLVVDQLTRTFRDGQVVVMIIHADFKRRLLVEMVGQDHNPQIFGKLRNVGITKVDFAGDRWQLDWFNSVSHLPARLITGNE
jgi:2,3-bisphosphoglycerate-dependent phosphoglycerate mutase